MRGRVAVRGMQFLAVFALLLSCAQYGAAGPADAVGSAAPSGASIPVVETLPAQPASTPPVPSMSASESPSLPPPTSKPTPVPTPTPTPDPWAQYFTDGPAYVKVPDADKGPWIYKDGSLHVAIELQKLGTRPYFLAEIYTRDGVIPFGGFAYCDASARKKALPYLIARQNNTVFGITGDFVVVGNNPKGVMIRQGKVYKDAKRAPTLAVMPDGELRVFDAGKITAAKLLEMGVKDSFAFGPILVRGGKIDKSVYTHRLRPHNWRAAIGQAEKGHYFAVVNPVGLTLAQLAQIFVDNGCTVAYNLDGGHSASIVFMGEQLYKQAPGEDHGEQRAISDLLMIGVNPAVPDPSAPVYCNGLAYNRKYRPKPTDGLLR